MPEKTRQMECMLKVVWSRDFIKSHKYELRVQIKKRNKAVHDETVSLRGKPGKSCYGKLHLPNYKDYINHGGLL